MMPWSWIKNLRYLGWAICLAALVASYPLGLQLGAYIVLLSYMFAFSKMELISQLLSPDTKSSSEADRSKDEEAK